MFSANFLREELEQRPEHLAAARAYYAEHRQEIDRLVAGNAAA